MKRIHNAKIYIYAYPYFVLTFNDNNENWHVFLGMTCAHMYVCMYVQTYARANFGKNSILANMSVAGLTYFINSTAVSSTLLNYLLTLHR